MLPYRIGDERVTKWLEQYETIFSNALDSFYYGDDVIEACKIVTQLVDNLNSIYNDELNTPHRDGISLLKNFFLLLTMI